MIRKLSTNESFHTENFGGFCPYWTILDEQVLIADTAEDIINALPNKRRIVDPVAVLELLQFNYILGNRTIVKGIQRMPWHSILNSEGILLNKPPIQHSNRKMSSREAAIKLGMLLEEELFNILSKHDRVYILLTGGLDSRVVAGIIKKIEKQIDTEINCVTWGDFESRDVVYAKQIANWFDWNFIHVPYDHERTWRNIINSAVWGGSEVAGFHLHGMDFFRNAESDDLVIAASFGDGIGRAEYSSVHLSNLELKPIKNTMNLIHPSLSSICIKKAIKDREFAWYSEENLKGYIRCELDMQENYMRRMIAHAMNYIRQFCNLYQAFTCDEVVRHMWSLPLPIRSDKIYHYLLQYLDNRLYSLPWARTGIAPNGSKEKRLNLRRQYHNYGKWLKNELRNRFEDLFFSKDLESLGIFYRPAKEYMWNQFVAEEDSKIGYAQIIVLICSLEISRKHFGLLPCRKSTPFRDEISYKINKTVKKTKKIFNRVIDL